MLATPPTEPMGIYLHLPFCRERCPYCDFFVLVERGGNQAEKPKRFMRLLRREIELALTQYPALRQAPVATIYFGGGTPSIQSTSEIAAVVSQLRQAFAVAPDAEVTLEANPGTLFEEHLPQWRQAGINRLSLGIQALDDAALRLLGRAHGADDNRRALEAVGRAGFASYSADLIFGYPGQTVEQLEAFLRELAGPWNVPHISAYALTIHEGTAFHKRRAEGRLILPSDDITAAMFQRLRDLGRELGMPPYEISNLARAGHHSRHNTAYWQLVPIVPLGPSACGYLDGRRVENPRSWEEWAEPLERGELAWRWEEPLTGRTLAGEVLMVSLRRSEGATFAWLRAKTGAEIRELYAEELRQADRRGWLHLTEESIRLTDEGMLWSDAFFESLF